jgi:hypothetical protein
MTAAVPVQRGCGSRKEGGVYLESGLVAGGRPIEEFLFDPPLDETSLPAEWMKPSRTPQLFERDGVHHVVIWVGEDFYPNVFDFVEETRVAGASRRVPRTFDFSKLTSASRMYFVHAHALVDGDVLVTSSLSCQCPKRMHAQPHEDMIETRRCLGLAKYLPTRDVHDYTTSDVPAGRYRTRTLPCGHAYELPETPSGIELQTKPAMFMMLPLTGIACVTKSDGSFDETVEQRVRTAGVDVFKTDQ